MEPNSDSFHNTYSEFEVVTRKNKRKKRQRKKKFLVLGEPQSESEASPTVESTGDSNLTDNSADELGSDDPPSQNVTSPQVSSFDSSNVNYSKSNISRDAWMSAPPTINASSDKENYFEEDVIGPSHTIRKISSVEDKVIYGEPVEEECELLLNTKALSKDASTYELEKFEKHALIIFNQENVDGFEKRHGTEKDVEKLVDTFTQFGFEVTEHKDLTKDKIIEELDAFTSRNNNLTDYGCVAVAILTHGSSAGLLRAKDQQFSEIEIIHKFKVLNNQTLVTKPKIIIVQACRGTKIVPGVPVMHSGKIRRDLDLDAVEPYILPVESDMLILHSSYAGSPSHRNELHGSWFIQELCDKINSLAATQDLETIMTEVKKEVAINKHHEEYNRRTLEMDINKQMPVVTSTLIRKLFLRKYGEVPPKIETFTDRPHRSVSSDAKNEALDNATTPLLVQYGPCSCFLDHFNYMRSCLKYFVEENPFDDTAKNFWEVANTFEDGVEFNTCKEKMSKAIAKHLLNHARNHQYYKYLYFYKHE